MDEYREIVIQFGENVSRNEQEECKYLNRRNKVKLIKERELEDISYTIKLLWNWGTNYRLFARTNS